LPAQSVSVSDLSKMKLLMVEDDKMNQFVLSKIIRRWKIDLEIAANGQEAINMLEKNRYHAVLMDVHMPVMDGFEATRLIRSGSTAALNPQIPIIALTGDITNKGQEQVYLAGMNDYLSKPIDPTASLQKAFKIHDLTRSV
jgi:CheY-like chemotaxis protein